MGDIEIDRDDLMAACTQVVARTGATSFELRLSNDGGDDHPVVYVAIALYPDGRYEAAAAPGPGRAAYRLVEALMDGGHCTHCDRPTGVTLDIGQQLAPGVFCWWQYDPELKEFRRGCSGG